MKEQKNQVNENKPKLSEQYDMVDSSYQSYEWTFGHTLKRGIPHLLKMVQEQYPQEKIAGADIMGSGSIFYKIFKKSIFLPGIDYGLGVANLPLSDKEKKRDLSGKRDFINGDILSQSTWENISNRLVQHDIQGFDVIFCRPGFGLAHLSPNNQVWLLDKMVSVLKPRHGTVFMEFSQSSLPQIQTYATQLEETGYKVKIDQNPTKTSGIIRIDKNLTSKV